MIISSWRIDETPLLTSAVYARNATNQDGLLIRRGLFEATPLAGERDDPRLPARLGGTIITWDGYEAFGSAIETRLGPTDARPRLKLSNPGSLTYATFPRGLEVEVPGQLEEENATPIDIDVVAAAAIRAVHETQREWRIASLIEDSGTVSTWAAAGFAAIGAVADIVGQLTQVIDDVEDSAPGRMRPNLMILGRTVARTIRDLAQTRGIEASGAVVAAGRAQAPRSVQWVEQWLSDMLDIRVVVGRGRINTAAQGQAAVLTDIWNALGVYLLWDGPAGVVADAGEGAQIMLAETRSVLTIDATAAMSTGMWERPDRRVHYIYGDERRGEVLLGQDLAYYFSAALTGA